MLRIITFTSQGCLPAKRIADRIPARLYRKFHTPGKTEMCPENFEPVKTPLADWAADGFAAGDPLLFIGAAGIAVRAIAGCIRDKLTDVPVLVMDMQGTYVIPILSGHYGGANALARRIAELTGAVAVITTATDQVGAFAADLFAKEHNMRIRNPKALPGLSGKAVSGEIIRIACPEHLRVVCGTPEGVCIVSPEDAADIRITAFPLTKEELESTETLYLTPQCIYAGIGCKKNVPTQQMEAFVRSMCESSGIDPEALAGIASIDVKKEEPAILALAETLGIPFVTYSAEELQAVPGHFPESPFVEKQVGVGEVSGRAAARLAGEGYRMLLPKVSRWGITLSLAVAAAIDKTGETDEEKEDRITCSAGR